MLHLGSTTVITRVSLAIALWLAILPSAFADSELLFRTPAINRTARDF